MKKIRRLSLIKKKKISEQENDEEEANEGDQQTKSPTKGPFGGFRKKFFSVKSKSQSMTDDACPAEETSKPDLSADKQSKSNGLSVLVVEKPDKLSKQNVGDHKHSNNYTESSTISANVNGLSASANGNNSAGDAVIATKENDEVATKEQKDEVEMEIDQPHSSNSSPDVNNVENDKEIQTPESQPYYENLPVSVETNHHIYATDIDVPVSPAAVNDLNSLTHPVLPQNIARHTLTSEFKRLAQQGWYWGPLTRTEAEDKLNETTDGSFLVRDSSDERYLLSLSFRSFGRTLHTRIEHSTGCFSFYANSGIQSYTSVVDLIADSVRDSQEAGVFCYSRSRAPQSPTFPVRLTYPVSRLSQVRTLQYLCRFVIRQYTRIDHIEKLPLPVPVKGYLNQSYF